MALQLQQVRKGEVIVHQIKIGRKKSLIRACSLMMRVEWRRLKSVLWSNKERQGIELNCFDIYLSMNMVHGFLIWSLNSSTLIQFTLLFIRYLYRTKLQFQLLPTHACSVTCSHNSLGVILRQ